MISHAFQPNHNLFAFNKVLLDVLEQQEALELMVPLEGLELLGEQESLALKEELVSYLVR